MSSDMSPDVSLFSRPIPDGLSLDIDGLVESWIAEAEDWLIAYESVESLTDREAFEGIECLGRLTRCKRDWFRKLGGEAVFVELQQVLAGADAAAFAHHAIAFPNLEEWLAQAKQAWDDEQEAPELMEVLIRDLDAADLVVWFIEAHAETVATADLFKDFSEKLATCARWAGRHAVLFVAAESFIRATAQTFPEDCGAEDMTGCLGVSMLKYIWLLDEIEAVWSEPAGMSVHEILRQDVSWGGRGRDYQRSELPAAAGATPGTEVPVLPIAWRDPSGRFEAELYLPSYRDPSGTTFVDLLFGAGAGFFEPATALIGTEVRLGNASGTIDQRVQGGAPLTFARLILEQIPSTPDSPVSLRVNGVVWMISAV